MIIQLQTLSLDQVVSKFINHFHPSHFILCFCSWIQMECYPFCRRWLSSPQIRSRLAMTDVSSPRSGLMSTTPSQAKSTSEKIGVLRSFNSSIKTSNGHSLSISVVSSVAGCSSLPGIWWHFTTIGRNNSRWDIQSSLVIVSDERQRIS